MGIDFSQTCSLMGFSYCTALDSMTHVYPWNPWCVCWFQLWFLKVIRAPCSRHEYAPEGYIVLKHTGGLKCLVIRQSLQMVQEKKKEHTKYITMWGSWLPAEFIQNASFLGAWFPPHYMILILCETHLEYVCRNHYSLDPIQVSLRFFADHIASESEASLIHKLFECVNFKA